MHDIFVVDQGVTMLHLTHDTEQLASKMVGPRGPQAGGSFSRGLRTGGRSARYCHGHAGEAPYDRRTDDGAWRKDICPASARSALSE